MSVIDIQLVMILHILREWITQIKFNRWNTNFYSFQNQLHEKYSQNWPLLNTKSNYDIRRKAILWGHLKQSQWFPQRWTFGIFEWESVFGAHLWWQAGQKRSSWSWSPAEALSSMLSGRHSQPHWADPPQGLHSHRGVSRLFLLLVARQPASQSASTQNAEIANAAQPKQIKPRHSSPWPFDETHLHPHTAAPNSSIRPWNLFCQKLSTLKLTSRFFVAHLA